MNTGRFQGKGFIAKLPLWLKAGFLRFWFAGAVFFFVGWGLPIQSADQLDLLLVLGMVHGLVTDILANRIIMFIAPETGQGRASVLCYSKRFFSVPVNLVFGLVFAALTAYTYHIINLAALGASGAAQGTVAFGAEPIGYGFFYFAFESIVITVKNTCVKIFKDAKGS